VLTYSLGVVRSPPDEVFQKSSACRSAAMLDVCSNLDHQAIDNLVDDRAAHFALGGWCLAEAVSVL